MAALHSALKSLGPLSFDEFPETSGERDKYVHDLFTQTELILESVPPPVEDPNAPPFDPNSPFAAKASEVRPSAARSAPPEPEYGALQKEWGKPIKLSAKDNPLGISVYKMSGKDGRGSWFARRSVHEGLGFARFKRGLEREFPESLKVQGAPGVGNIRGIGGERRVENISIENGKGKVEVYHLSAQFPGPTTPRDFVTFLVTSSSSMKEQKKDGDRLERPPRHYTIISKPCDHPDTQPRDGFIRGSYESVEFIREVPRRPKRSQSSIDLARLRGKSPPLDRSAMLRNSEKTNTLPMQQPNGNANDNSRMSPRVAASDDADDRRRSTSRGRGATISFAESRGRSAKGEAFDNPNFEDLDPERNPIEWIMITRSDPGGSVPRFMVERGTPSSIVADASKFLDWACQAEHPDIDADEEVEQNQDDPTLKIGNFESFQANGHLAGISEDGTLDERLKDNVPISNEESHHSSKNSSKPPSIPGALPDSVPSDSLSGSQPGFMAGVSSYIGSYAPHALTDYISGSRAATPTKDTHQAAEDDDATSTISSTSFASADSHLRSRTHDIHASIHSSTSHSSLPKIDAADPTTNAVDRGEPIPPPSSDPDPSLSKELQKMAEKRAAFSAELAAARSKAARDTESQSQRSAENLRKTEERHARELKRMEDKHAKEVEKLARKKSRERRKEEEKRRKQEDKDEKTRLVRERDEARAALEEARKLGELRMKQVGDLQRENTRLTALLGGRGGRESEESLAVGGRGEVEGGNGGAAAAATAGLSKDAIRALIGEEKAQGRLRGLSFGSGGAGSTSGGSRSGSLRREKET
ncbi:MAG: hypothetical protein Q9227_001214 [Pyrenula ochraceoflavens]